MKYIFRYILYLHLTAPLFGQSLPDFSSPVKHNIILSGSFGELRSGHFHSGLDIKSSRGVQGDSIFSIYEGHIARIKVEPGGYGNSLYIIHPNGYTSVYAHLKSFEDDISDFTKQSQIIENCFTVDVKPNKEKFKVKKGQFIGLMGNSGKSFGPHLHFEIRNTKTDLLINPITLGIKPKDTRPPVINSMTLYEYNGLMNIVHEEVVPIKNSGSSIYRLTRDTLFVNSLDSFSLSIKLFDRMNGASNKNGVYQITTLLNDTLFSSLCFDSIRFEDSNDVQFLIDQKRMRLTKSINHMFDIGSNYPFSFSKQMPKKLNVKLYLDYKIVLTDFMSNESSIEFVISEKTKNHKNYYSNYIIEPDKSSLIDLKNFTIFIKQKTFQKKQGISLFEREIVQKETITPTIYIEPKHQNLSQPIELIYKSKNNNLTEKYCFSYFENGKSKLISNCQSDSICHTEISNFQNFFITIDTIPPSIQPLFTKTTFRKNNLLSFSIEDNLEPTRKSQYLNINGTLNNTWILFEYDLKTKTITYKIGDSLKKGEYDLDLQVTDNQGNSSCFFKTIKII